MSTRKTVSSSVIWTSYLDAERKLERDFGRNSLRWSVSSETVYSARLPATSMKVNEWLILAISSPWLDTAICRA